MTRLLLLSGSQRRESFNTRLLKNFAERLDGCCDIDLINVQDIRLPIFDQDYENDPSLMESVMALHERFQIAQGLIVASPEYNNQLPPFIKNLVDWLSRPAYLNASLPNPFYDLPTLCCSSSTGWSGGAFAIPQARALFGYVGCLVMGDSLSFPYADRDWTGDGFLFDPRTDEQINISLNRLMKLSQLLETHSLD
jgi:chromate reductase